MEPIVFPYYHTCDTYYTKRSIKELEHLNLKESSSTISDLRFEESVIELQVYLLVECVNNRVNGKQSFVNNGTKIEEWFSSTATQKRRTYDIKCINISFEKIKSFPKTDDVFPLSTKGGNYWYHGTTQESAESIRNVGIILEEGQEKQDFSHSSGFYLNPRFSDAAEWASRRFRETAGAILIYNLPLDDFQGLNLFNDLENWQKVVGYYRSGCKRVIDNQLVDHWDQVDFIRGEMSGDGYNPEIESWKPQRKPDKSQLCIRSRRMAKEFSLALQGIIYFSDRK